MINDNQIKKAKLQAELRARAFLSLTLQFGSYFSTVVFCNVVCLVLVQALGLPKEWAAASLLLANVLGIILAVGLNFALTPAVLQLHFPCSPAKTEPSAELVSKLFHTHSLRKPDIYFFNSELESTKNAVFIAGFESFPWIKTAVFLSPHLEQRLSEDELTAVLLHEIAHQKHSHLRKRFTFLCSQLFQFMFLGGLIFSLATRLFGVAPVVFSWLIAAWICFATLYESRKQMQRHEFEADALSVTELNADHKSLIQALRKLGGDHGTNAHFSLGTHPSLEARIEQIKELERVKNSSNQDYLKKAA